MRVFLSSCAGGGGGGGVPGLLCRVFLHNGELELDQDRDVPMIDGAVSPHEGLTQTQETQVFEDTQVMEETEEGEIDVNLDDDQMVEGLVASLCRVKIICLRQRTRKKIQRRGKILCQVMAW